MASHHKLTLHTVQLHALGEWVLGGDGLYLLFPKCGAGRFTSATTAQPVGPGAVLVVNAAAGGRLCAPAGSHLVFRFFSVGLEQLSLLVVGPEIGQMQNVFEGLKCAKFHPAGSPLAAQCQGLLEESPPPFNLAHRSHLLRVAAVVLAEEFDQGRTGDRGFVRMEEHVAQVLEKLTAEEILNLSVGELAERFSCSSRHLSRLFHQYFGLSVITLKMEMRLLKAAALLRDPDTKVIAVAEQSGFNHLGLFNTCFKRRFGVSPGEWRKRSSQSVRPPAGFMERDPSCWMLAAGLCAWDGGAARGQKSRADAARGSCGP